MAVHMAKWYCGKLLTAIAFSHDLDEQAPAPQAQHRNNVHVLQEEVRVMCHRRLARNLNLIYIKFLTILTE